MDLRFVLYIIDNLQNSDINKCKEIAYEFLKHEKNINNRYIVAIKMNRLIPDDLLFEYLKKSFYKDANNYINRNLNDLENSNFKDDLGMGFLLIKYYYKNKILVDCYAQKMIIDILQKDENINILNNSIYANYQFIYDILVKYDFYLVNYAILNKEILLTNIVEKLNNNKIIKIKKINIL